MPEISLAVAKTVRDRTLFGKDHPDVEWLYCSIDNKHHMNPYYDGDVRTENPDLEKKEYV